MNDINGNLDDAHRHAHDAVSYLQRALEQARSRIEAAHLLGLIKQAAELREGIAACMGDEA
jgi:hypothetical protein